MKKKTEPDLRQFIVASKSDSRAAIQMFFARPTVEEASDLAEMYLGPNWENHYYIGVVCLHCGRVMKNTRATKCTRRACGRVLPKENS